MQQSNEYTPTGAHVWALTSVVQTLLAHVLALEPTQEAADALVARLRRASRHVPRFSSINDLPIAAGERKFHWPLGRRPDGQTSLTEFGL